MTCSETTLLNLNKMTKKVIDSSVFDKIDIRIGTVLQSEVFVEARQPAYQLWIDFGALGIKKTSAQITQLYAVEELVGRQVLAVVNFVPKQIAHFMSECLLLGAITDQGVVLLHCEQKTVNGITVR